MKGHEERHQWAGRTGAEPGGQAGGGYFPRLVSYRDRLHRRTGHTGLPLPVRRPVIRNIIGMNYEKYRFPGLAARRYPPPHQPSPFGSASAILLKGGVIRPLPGARASRPHPVPANFSAPASGPGCKPGTRRSICLRVYWCLFVSIRGSSSLTIGRFSSNDPHGRAEGRLIGGHVDLEGELAVGVSLVLPQGRGIGAHLDPVSGG